MTKTGIAIVFTVVGAGIGFGIAQLIHTVACVDKTIYIDPNSSSTNLGDTLVCFGKNVTWQSRPSALMNVEWTGMENPTTAPEPYNLNCKDFTSSVCFSGPMSPNAKVGSKAKYKVTFKDNPNPYNGRIIIQKAP